MKGTKLPMRDWFFALYFFTQSKNSISSLEVASHLGITQKNAWALTKKLQALTKETSRDKFTGIVEIDVTYIGGKKKAPKDAEKRIGFNGQEHKIKVFAIRERRTGRIRTFIIETESIAETLPIIIANVEIGSTIHSDEAAAYKCLPKYGFKHAFVRHKKFEWKRGNVTIQPLEGFWSYLKRSIRGTHIWISKDFMRSYLDEMEFRYNHCNDGTENTFFILAGRLFNADIEDVRNLLCARKRS